MKPEYIGIGNFDEDNYVYAYCKCPLSTDYAIKWPLIKDGKPHSYSCTCEDCGTTVSTIAKSFGPEVYKEIEASGRSYDEFGFFDPFSVKEKESNDCISRQAVLDAIQKLNIPEDMCVFEIKSHIEVTIATLPSITKGENK